MPVISFLKVMEISLARRWLSLVEFLSNRNQSNLSIFHSFAKVNNQLSLMFSRANCCMDLLMEKKEIYDLFKKSMIELSSAIEPLLSLNPIPNGMVLHTPKSLTDVSLANTIKMASLLPITSLRMTFFFCRVEEHSCCLGGGFQMAHSREKTT